MTIVMSLLTACCATGGRNDRAESNEYSTLMDKEPPSTLKGLVRPQERPAFPLGKDKKPFAVIEDQGNKRQIKDKPQSIKEKAP